MDKFVIKKRKLTENEDKSTSVNTESESCVNVSVEKHLSQDVVLSRKNRSDSKLSSVRKYQENYLSFGFASTLNEDPPRPQCVICGEKLSNEAMVPSKLKRHLTTKHKFAADKPLEYFKRILSGETMQAKVFTKQKSIADKAQEASYAVAELVAKKMKSHTTAETLVKPACLDIVKIMFGEEFEKQVSKIPLSNNTISHRIKEMSEDVEVQVIDKLKSADMFALQLDESTDVSGKPQVVTFVRFVEEKSIIEQFLFCKDLPETTKGQDIFNLVDKYFENSNISWMSCVGVCIDGCPSMIGHLTGFLALAKKKNSSIVFTHCFLHREALVAKSLVPELGEVFNKVVKMVNYIKRNPLKCRVFKNLCNAMDSGHTQLLLHTEVRWLSRGRVLNRFYELREELLAFFTCEESEYADLLSDDNWCTKLAFLADMFQKLYVLNKSMQGRSENLLTSTDKIKSFKEKILIWKRKILKENSFDMFELTEKCNVDQTVLNMIVESLNLLSENIAKYFPSLDTSGFDWVRNPFIDLVEDKVDLSTKEEEELSDIKNDRGLKMEFEKLAKEAEEKCQTLKKKKTPDLAAFWVPLLNEYPQLTKKALKILIPFSTSYSCEAAFSAMNQIKTKNRSQLQTVEHDMRIALSNVQPRKSELTKKHQAHVSH